MEIKQQQKPTKKQKYYKVSPQILNVNTILKLNSTGIGGVNNLEINNANADVRNVNSIFNRISNNANQYNLNYDMNGIGMNGIGMNGIVSNAMNSNKYNIVKYLGEGIQGSLYLANDANKKRYICKKIMMQNDTNDSNIVNRQNNENQRKQIEFELNILKYLSMNNTTRPYINPCLEHKIVDNNIFTIFPVFDGYSLNHLTKYLKKINPIEYYRIVFHLIKSILHGLAKIHQTHIAHQNINDNSILVSTYTSPGEINIKFTDFGLGCSNDINRRNNMNPVNYQNTANDIFFKFHSCKENNLVPVSIDDNVMDKLSQSDFLSISQKYDLLCLGIMFIKLLLLGEKIYFDTSKGFNSEFEQQNVKRIRDKYLQRFTQGEKQSDMFYKQKFTNINISNKVKRDILEYLNIFLEYVLCKTSKRESCQYVLDKLIIYEKYRDDIF